jgi:hypothetical protein
MRKRTSPEGMPPMAKIATERGRGGPPVGEGRAPRAAQEPEPENGEAMGAGMLLTHPGGLLLGAAERSGAAAERQQQRDQDQAQELEEQERGEAKLPVSGTPRAREAHPAAAILSTLSSPEQVTL